MNFGDAPATVELDGPAELLFATGAGVDCRAPGWSRCPPHAGALVEPSAG